MLFWIILIICVFVGFIIFAFIAREPCLGLMGIPAAVVVLIIGLFIAVIGGSGFIADEIVEVKTTQIVALADNTTTNGSFFLGSGTVNEKNYYCYMEQQDDGGLRMSRISANEAIIYDNENANPHIDKYILRNSSPIVRFFFLTDRYEYKIYIPNNSIRYNFNIDLQ